MPAPDKIIDAEEKDFHKVKKEGEYFKIRQLSKDRRTNLFHTVTHILAVLIIFTFLLAFIITLIYQKKDLMPDYFIAIVSTVVGFYFGSYLKNNL
jgi:hypothetical protein